MLVIFRNSVSLQKLNPIKPRTKVRKIKRKFRKMAKTLTVYTLYGDDEALQIVLKRLIENSFAFHYTGEFLYDNTPWDEFIDTHCQDIKDRLHAYEEHWADNCLGFEFTESDTEFTFYNEGQAVCKAGVKPMHLSRALELFRKLCVLASRHGVNIQYGSNK